MHWRAHVDHVSRKCARATGQLWRHGQSLTLRARRMWYLSVVQSNLTYASNSFFPSLLKTVLTRLQKLHRAGVRAVFRAKPRTATAPLVFRLRVKPLLQLYLEKVLVFVFRCLHSLSSRLFCNFFSIIASTADHPVTRGQVTHLLRIPFLPQQSGRATMQFAAAAFWNKLPSSIRSAGELSTFKHALSSIDLILLHE